MKTTFVSTQSINAVARQSVAKLQGELVGAQKEMTTGRHADVGLALGSQTRQTVSLRQEHARLTAIIDTNSLVTSRLEASQVALTDVSASADSFLKALVAAKSARVPGLASGVARNGLETLTGLMNTTHNGENIFAGINTDVKPIAEYGADPASPAKAAVDAAFLARFGVAQDDPAAADILPADMAEFLGTDFAALFEPAAWSTTWSSASSQNIRSRVSPSELVETGANANEPGIRKLAMAMTMVADAGTDTVGEAAFEAILDQAIELVGSAAKDLTAARSRLGAAEERVTNANERMSLQLDILTTHVDALEGVDPYEASTRVSRLLTQIETAYALTAQIQRLSILNYL